MYLHDSHINLAENTTNKESTWSNSAKTANFGSGPRPSFKITRRETLASRVLDPAPEMLVCRGLRDLSRNLNREVQN